MKGYEISALDLSGPEVTRPSVKESIAKFKDGESFIWLHVRSLDRDLCAAFLRSEFRFPELTIEDAMSSLERPAVQFFDDLLFMVAPAVNSFGAGENYAEVAFFLKSGSLMTVTHEAAPVIESRLEFMASHPNKVLNNSMLLHMLIDNIVDDYFPAVDVLQDEVEELEDEIYTAGKSIVREALGIKRRILELRRHVSPIRDVVNTLLRRDIALIPSESVPYFQDVYDHTIRLNETIDLTRDILVSVLEANLAVISNNLNEVMRKMTVISTILMSMGFVCGVYGMNFEHMPELKMRYGYPLIWVAMVVIAGIELALFKRKKWL